MGAVAVTEQAIINEAHPEDYRFNRSKRDEENTAAAGAYVAFQKGLHKWIGPNGLESCIHP